MKTDVAGNELQIGDEVWSFHSYYKRLVKAVVVKFTPKGITVKYIDKNMTYNCRSNQLIKAAHNGTKSS